MNVNESSRLTTEVRNVFVIYCMLVRSSDKGGRSGHSEVTAIQAYKGKLKQVEQRSLQRRGGSLAQVAVESRRYLR